MAKRMLAIVSIYSAIFLMVYTRYSIRQTTTMQFIAIFMILGFLAIFIASIVVLFNCWKENKYKAFLPFSVCVMVLMYMIFAVPVVKDVAFHRKLVKYEKIVNMVNEGELVINTNSHRIELPDDYKQLAYVAFGEYDDKGVLTLEFFTGAGYPVKHSGYLYRSDGSITPDSTIHKKWRHIVRKSHNWYYFSD